jgi:hypothetical protein
MGKKHWLVAIALLLSSLALGCADSTTTTDKDEPDGFYTGLSTGAAHP